MDLNKIKIGNRMIGQGEPLYFIADIAANHDGDLERAYRLIELAKESGADAAKFQNFKADKIVSKKGFKSMDKVLSHQATWEKSIFEVYEAASIPEDWTEKLKKRCDEVGIEYMTSPYDFESIDLVNPFINAYKIGSGDITWCEIIDYIASKGKPVLIATGASDMKDVERAMAIVKCKNENIILMQCNTNYTASKENFKYINLNVLKTYKEKYPEVILGLSDHTFGDSTVLGAIALGALVIEKHFTDDNSRVGPDHKFSMNPKTWKEMIEKSYELYSALGNGIKVVEENEKDTIVVQRRCLYITKNIKVGEIIKANSLFPLRPTKEDGIAPYDLNKVLGKKASRDLFENDFLKWSDVNND